MYDFIQFQFADKSWNRQKKLFIKHTSSGSEDGKRQFPKSGSNVPLLLMPTKNRLTDSL